MYAQYTRTISDYSFSDSDVWSFFLSEKDRMKFEKKFNKGLKSGLTIDASIEKAGGDLNLADYGFIKVLRTDLIDPTVVEFIESKNGQYLLVERFECFSTSYEKHTLLEGLYATENELRTQTFEVTTTIKSKLKEQDDYNIEIRRLMSKNFEKQVEKKIKSLKGKSKKSIDDLKSELIKKLEDENKKEVSKVFEKVDKLQVELNEMMRFYMHTAFVKSFGARMLDVDYEVESNDESGIID